MDDELPPGGRQPDQGGRGPGAPTDPRRPADAARRCRRVPDDRAPPGGERGVPVDDELALLVVHGVLHLLDYDHAETEEATVMRRREQELLERFRELEGKG